MRVALAFALALGLTACATAPPRGMDSGAIPVPFIAQRPHQCGPAALAMLANFHGHGVSQAEVAESIYLPSVQGALTTDLAEYARRFGLWTRQYRGSADDLREKLAAGIPLIVLGKTGDSPHYFVVLAAGDPLVVHSDTRPFLKLARSEFLEQWAAANHWTLLVCPPLAARWELSAAEHNDLGLFYEQTDDPCMAESHYAQAAALEPGNAWYQFNLGNARLKQFLLDAAAVAFRRAIELEPAHADAHNNLAWVYHEQAAQLEEAATLARRAVELAPRKKAYYLDTLGSVLLKQGQRAAARMAFAEALAATTASQEQLRATIRARLAQLD